MYSLRSCTVLEFCKKKIRAWQCTQKNNPQIRIGLGLKKKEISTYKKNNVLTLFLIDDVPAIGIILYLEVDRFDLQSGNKGDTTKRFLNSY